MNFFLLILSFFLLLKLLIVTFYFFINFLFLQFFNLKFYFLNIKSTKKIKEKLGKFDRKSTGRNLWEKYYLRSSVPKNHLFYLILSHLTSFFISSFFIEKRKIFPTEGKFMQKIKEKDTKNSCFIFFLFFMEIFIFHKKVFTMKDNLFIFRWKSIFLN